MNIVESLANYLDDAGVATFGQDMFISRAPASNSYEAASGTTIPQNIWWLNAAGGTPNGVFDIFNVDIHYRDRDAQAVYDKLQDLQYRLTKQGLVQLEDFDVTQIQAAAPITDQDIDNEDRTVGLLQITITTYKENQNYAIS